MDGQNFAVGIQDKCSALLIYNKIDGTGSGYRNNYYKIMSTQEYTKLRNGLLIAAVPIFAVVLFQAFSVYFAMQNKIDRTEYQEALYNITLLVERKTLALEKIATSNEKENISLMKEVDNINVRIDVLYQRQNRMRSATENGQ